MPQWLIDLLAALAGPKPAGPPPFEPTFEGQHYVTGANGIPVPLNIDYFATEETAMEVARRFGGDHVAGVKYQGSGGPEQTDARERWVVFRDGIACNAGLLAAQFRRNPEDVYPHVAENACWHDIASARASGQKLPVE